MQYNNFEGESLHADYKNLVNIVHWGMIPDAESLKYETRDVIAPSLIVKHSYNINYGKFQNE